jgi:hypothetical protein
MAACKSSAALILSTLAASTNGARLLARFLRRVARRDRQARDLFDNMSIQQREVMRK